MSIPRAALIERVEITGPGGNRGNDRIRERLTAWAEKRASYFYIYSGVGTPLNQIGAAHAADDVIQWLDAFDEWAARQLGLDEERIAELIASENRLTVEHVDGLPDEELDKLRGIKVLVAD